MTTPTADAQRRGPGRPRIGGTRVNYLLTDEIRAVLREVGDGNETEGVRRLVAAWSAKSARRP